MHSASEFVQFHKKDIPAEVKLLFISDFHRTLFISFCRFGKKITEEKPLAQWLAQLSKNVRKLFRGFVQF